MVPLIPPAVSLTPLLANPHSLSLGGDLSLQTEDDLPQCFNLYGQTEISVVRTAPFLCQHFALVPPPPPPLVIPQCWWGGTEVWDFPTALSLDWWDPVDLSS